MSIPRLSGQSGPPQTNLLLSVADVTQNYPPLDPGNHLATVTAAEMFELPDPWPPGERWPDD